MKNNKESCYYQASWVVNEQFLCHVYFLMFLYKTHSIDETWMNYNEGTTINIVIVAMWWADGNKYAMDVVISREFSMTRGYILTGDQNVD
jgi:hypothetical protein